MDPSSKAKTNAQRPPAGVLSNISYQPNHGHSLLEEWPHNKSASNCSRKEVTFSEYSELRLYSSNKSYQVNKSYSDSDIQTFRTRASFEALRIRSLISEYPLQGWSVIKHVMGLGLLTHEDLVGIEHLVCENAAEQTLRERRAHLTSILKAQELLKEKYENVVHPSKLARLSSVSSEKHVQNARARAAWSLVRGKNTIGAGKKMGTTSAITGISRIKSDIKAAFAA
ncbi:hypothetical protein HJC23_006928 [Cyclotella cryptica]|uniref:Uncharacterized protein n=1 Tax=Cyclotella cryptica TaxID=29204 RepID=A0ABD3QCM4_9STRA